MSSLVPLRIRLPLKFQGSEITAIRIQDIARDVWYSWDKNSQYPNGYWDNSGGSGNNAPVGQTPMITPGPGNLYIAFYAKNLYTYSVNMTLYIYDVNYVVLAATINAYTAAGAAASAEYTGNMPIGNYTIILYSEP